MKESHAKTKHFLFLLLMLLLLVSTGIGGTEFLQDQDAGFSSKIEAVQGLNSVPDPDPPWCHIIPC